MPSIFSNPSYYPGANYTGPEYNWENYGRYQQQPEPPPVVMPPVTVTESPFNTGGLPNGFRFNDYGAPTPANPFSYENPYHGPMPIPELPRFGEPSMILPVTTDPTIIGAIDPNTGLPIRHDPPPVELEPEDIHPADPMGPSNPTIYGGDGGLFGTGIDIGIPGLISIGGLLGAGGGLLGLGGSMGGFGSNTSGGGGGQTNNSPPLIPPVVGPPPDPAPPQNNEPPPTIPPVVGPAPDPQPTQPPPQNQPEPPITVPPIIPGGGPDENPQPVTLPPPIQHYPEPNPPPQETPAPPITIPPIITPTNGPSTPPPVENPNPPTTVPPPVINTPPIIPPVINPGTGGGPNPPTTNMPQPLDRNYYREGNQTNQDHTALLPGIFNNYANYSGQYGSTDMANFQALLQSLAGYNPDLTAAANAQTVASNTALRTGNVNDAATLGGTALNTMRSLNPNMYGSLTQANQQAGTAGSPSQIQQMLEQQAREELALGGNLSQDDIRRSQQAAREAWSARGLVNSNGAVADEVLNRDYMARQRQAERRAFAAGVDQQGYGQRQQGYSNILNNAQLQMAGAFNPFSTVTSATTANQGTNQSLFNQGAGFSSGAFSNQNVNNLVNPFNPYANDVYDSNFNAANARYISAGNNAAAMAGARDATNGALANAFIDFAGNYFGSLCWVAREVFGADNPKWLQFREWVLTKAPADFRHFYRTHGPLVAGLVRLNENARHSLREWMEAQILTVNPS